MKKIIAFTLACLMVLGTTSAFAAAFNDIEGHWGEAEITSAYEKGIVNGYEDGTFRPDDTVTRAEFVKMLSSVVVTKLGVNDVPDQFKTEDTWYSKYYTFAKLYFLATDSENAINGINPGVLTAENASSPIQRWEMAHMSSSLMVNFLGKNLTSFPIFSDSAEIEKMPGNIPYGIRLAADQKIMTGTGNGEFSPYGTGTRAQATAIVLRINDLIDKQIADEIAKENETIAKENEAAEKVKFEMENGETFTVALLPQYAPETVANFKSLVESGFYDGLTFHRVIEGFMAQGGDPNGDGSGGSGKTIKGEFAANGFTQNTLSHQRGVISMARTNDPNSASSGFFICYDDASFLDGSYAAFGRVVEGMDVVDSFLKVERGMNILGEEATPLTPIVIKKATMVK